MEIKKGMTLAEVLITLTIIGVGTAIMIPIISNVIPDANKVAFKKVYSIIEQTVSTLINDEDYYPSCRHVTIIKDPPANTDFTSVPAGFFIPDATTLTQMLNNTSNCTGGDVPPTSNTNKFCYFFSQQIKTTGAVNCSQSSDANGAATSAGNTTFTSQNGMTWTIVSPAPQFSIVDSSGAAFSNNYSTRIIVDINGTKAPNCSFIALSYNGYSAPACSSSTVWPTNPNGKAPDIYDIGVRYDGSLTIYKMNAAGTDIDTVNNIDLAAQQMLKLPMKNTSGSSVN